MKNKHVIHIGITEDSYTNCILTGAKVRHLEIASLKCHHTSSRFSKCIAPVVQLRKRRKEAVQLSVFRWIWDLFWKGWLFFLFCNITLCDISICC